MTTNDGRYAVKCDECKDELRRTESLHESAAGGICESCCTRKARS